MIPAELPDPEESEQARRLHDIVVNSMTHHERGHTHPTAACTESGRCSEGFPKPFTGQTERGGTTGCTPRTDAAPRLMEARR